MEKIAEGIWKIRYGDPELYTPVCFNDTLTRFDAIEVLRKCENPPFKESELSFRMSSRGCLVEHMLDKTESIYGFGLQLKSFNQNCKKKTLRVNSDPVADTGDSHAPVPFYVSTKGYGVFVDTLRYAAFYCRSHQKVRKPEGFSAQERNEIAGNTEELYSAGNMDKDTIVIDIPVAKGIDIYVFGGPAMKNAIQRYNLFAGGGCLPPLWGLGVLYRSYGKSDASMAVRLAQHLREAGIPCSVFGMEPSWQSHSYSCSYAWDPVRFQDPDKFLQEMYDMHFNVNLWEHAFTHPSSPVYEPLERYSGDYEVWGGLVPDFNMKEAADIFSSYHKQQFADKGITGFKLDECDNSDFIASPWSFPEFSRFPSGLDGEQMHSRFGLAYSKALLDMFQAAGIRTYGQVRSLHALASSLPFVIYSDLYDHKDFIRGLVNAGFSGLLWTPEVRECKSEDDLVRRLQTVVFSPQACINAWMIPNPPWLQYDLDKNLKNELLDNMEEVQDLCRAVLNLRMSLLPYLYSSFAQYWLDGQPPFRALVMDYPEDTETYDIDDQYMMGADLLIAPMTAVQKSRKVYLPEGDWYCFWTNKKYNGLKWYEIELSVEQIPVFVKNGSLLPLAEPLQYADKDTCFDITVNCYGDNCSDFNLFEDDGISFAYSKGVYNIVKLCGDLRRVERSGHYEGTRYNIRKWNIIR